MLVEYKINTPTGTNKALIVYAIIPIKGQILPLITALHESNKVINSTNNLFIYKTIYEIRGYTFENIHDNLLLDTSILIKTNLLARIIFAFNYIFNYK